MLKKYFLPILICSVVSISQKAFSQSLDSTSFKIYTRLSFYSYEKAGEFLVHVPPLLLQNHLSISIQAGEKTLATYNGIPGRSILRIPFSLNLAPADYNTVVNISLTKSTVTIYKATTDLVVLAYKSNEVKTDRLTGGLIVNRRQFFPFGFYCYSPVYPTLPEEEVVKGFNMISPYQKIMPETLSERKAYMDRCAELGMKVHYNLLSVSGGGGVGSKIDGLGDEEKENV